MRQKLLFNGGLNSDTSPYLMPPGDALNNINVRTFNSKDGKQGAVISIHGNTIIQDLSSYGTLTPIGWYEDIPGNRIIVFYYNENGRHLVISYCPSASNPITVILDNNNFSTSGINKGLNFSIANNITNIGMVGDILSWVDGISGNRPRKYNTSRSSFVIHTPSYPLFTDDLITIICRPPAYPLSTVKLLASSIGVTLVNNFIANQAFQFAYRYVYLDGEQSVISPYSLMNNYDYPTKDPVSDPQYDTIQVSIPFSEIIPANCYEIDVCVRNGNTGNFFVIHSWNIDSDLTDINQHNAGVQQLQFNFFNDQTGQALDTAYAAKLFDNVPMSGQALGVAKNMIFISNYKEGYNAPSSTSLTISLVPDTVDKTNAIGMWWQVSWKHNLDLHQAYVLYVPQAATPGYYYYAAYSDGGPFPSTLNISDGILAGTDFHSVVGYYVHNNFTGVSLRNFFAETDTTTLNDLFTLSSDKPELKSNSAWQVGIVFYDEFLQNCGTVTNKDLRATTPVWGYGTTGLYQGIQWALDNTNALTEIPEFAVYYSIVRTKNLRYLSFIQAAAHQVAYYSGDGNDTPYNFVFGSYSPAPTYVGVAVDISLLDNNGLGYTYQQGDVLYLYMQFNPHNLNPYYALTIKGQYGTWVLCELVDLGFLADYEYDKLFFEIATPYIPSLNEPYYEVGNLYPVSNPGTSDRQYTTLQGMLEGDITLLTRIKSDGVTDYIVEAMSPNDQYFLNWFTDIGRVNGVVQQPGQLTDPYGIRWSNQFIQGTKINGLSSFDALNQQDVPSDAGAVMKLTLTSKIQEEGTVMLANCQKETLSIYLQESQVYQSTQQGAFTQSITSVIGTINPLRGGYGCLHPESIVEESGRVYFYSIYKGCVVRYSDDGLTPISDYKLSNFINTRSNLLLDLINENEASGGSTIYRCLGAFDRFNKEYLLFLPQVNDQPNKIIPDVTPNTYSFNLNGTYNSVLKPLTFYQVVITVSVSTTINVKYGTQTVINKSVSGTYTMPLYFKTGLQHQSIVISTSPTATGTVVFNEILLDPYEIEDYQQKTIGFNESSNLWPEQYTLYPDGFIPLNSDLITLSGSKIYKENSSDTFNNFFGQQFNSKVAKLMNDNVPLVKYLQAICVESNICPDYLHLRTVFANDYNITPEELTNYILQSTDLVSGDFTYMDGIWYAAFLKDRLTPGFDNYDEALNFGDDLQSQWAYLMLEFNTVDYLLILNSIDIGYTVSKGHYTMASKT